MNIISVANQKGGVGKTTTACNIAAGLAIKGFSTLLVDIDCQGNATRTYLDPTLIDKTLADVFIGDVASLLPITSAIYETDLENLDLAASHIRMATLEQQTKYDELFRLKDALDTLKGYDFVIIDCPPTLGTTLTQALLASTKVLIPIAAEFYAFDGVNDLDSTITSIKRSNPKLDIIGYVLTRFDSRTTASAECFRKAQDTFGDLFFETFIRTNTKLISAPAFKQSIYEHDPKAYGSEDYLNLTLELLDRMKITKHLKLVEKQA